MIKVPVVDVSVTPMTSTEVVDLVLTPVDRPTLILNHNLHSTFLYHTDSAFRALYEAADYVVIDGWPILALLRFGGRSGSVQPDHRIGSTDWLEGLMNRATPRVRIFVLGGASTPNAQARARLSRALPSAVVAGRDGYFDIDQDGPDIADEMVGFRPDVVIVGMGMPHQERFLTQHLERLPPAYYATVGGAIHYLAGETSLSPRWLGQMGLEWLWRFAHEPRRLFARYFLEPITLAAVLVRRRVRKVRNRGER